MRLIKLIIAVIFLGAAFGTSAGQAEPNDLAGYYGFGEIEIIKLNWGINSLRIADFNGDGRGDIAVVNNRKANIELLLQKEAVGPGETEVTVDPEDIDINAITSLTRFKRETVPVSQKVYSFVYGDLNSDGMVDLAFYGKPEGLYVILQRKGEKTSSKEKSKLSWRTRKKIKIDDGLLTSNALVCADLNNDGADDLVLAGRDAVYIVTQKEDGSLSEPVKYATSARILSVEVSDLNGDKINDLVLITADNEKPIHVRFGLETPEKKGQLGPLVQFFIEKPYALELADIDKKTGAEILTVDSRSGRLISYKLTTKEEKDIDWPVLFYPLASGKESTKRDLVIGDFDGDGLDDITISDPGAAEIIFYKQIKHFGLAEPVRFPAFTDITSLTSADIDGDGKSEIGVLSIKERAIGVSKFEDDRLLFPQPVKTTDEPIAMELADVDSDGKTDCLYISKDANDVKTLRVIYTFMGTDQSKAGLLELFKKKSKQDKSTEQVGETESALELKELLANPDGLKIVDVDQDGLEDILIFVKYEYPTLVRQTQKRQFEVIDLSGAQSSLIKDAGLHSIAAANVDEQPGRELLVAQNNFARSLVFEDGKRWIVIDQYNAKSTENTISAVAAFDIDYREKKGRASILLLDGQKGQLQILKSGPDKTYRFEKELSVGKWNKVKHSKMLFAALTGKKTRSILLFDSEKFALIVPPDKSKAWQQLEQQYSYETKIKDGFYGNITAGDINSDGRIDIIMVEQNRNHIEILALDSQGKPTPAMRFKVFEQKAYHDSKKRRKANVEPKELKIADVTGDDRDDLVAIIHDRIIIYPQD